LERRLPLKRIALVTLVGASLLTALPSYGVSSLNLSFTTKGLTPGSRVWVEVLPEYQAEAVGKAYKDGFEDLGLPQPANSKHAWRFEVPASGVVAPATHNFQFPAAVAVRSSDHFGFVYLQVRFRIDDPTRKGERGYNKLETFTFAMPAHAGVNLLSRCLRLAEKGSGGLTVGIAGDCRDATFAEEIRNAKKVPGSAPPQ